MIPVLALFLAAMWAPRLWPHGLMAVLIISSLGALFAYGNLISGAPMYAFGYFVGTCILNASAFGAFYLVRRIVQKRMRDRAAR